MSVKLADVATRVGVSTMTVSRALNGASGVSARTRDRVLEAAKALGYVGNSAARSLVGGKTNVLGMILGDLGAQYNIQLVAGVGRAAAAAGLDLLLSTTSNAQERELERTALLGKGLVDGLVAVLPRDPEYVLEALERAGTPVVIVDHRGAHTNIPTIAADNYHGARLAMQHLVDLGHTRIGYIGGVPEVIASQERLLAYRDGLSSAGLRFDPKLIGNGDFTQKAGFHAALELLGNANPPTAIFTANDLTAFGAIEAIKERGLRVPHDVSVIGFDDVPMASQIHPPLTTVRQPLEDMGAAAVNTLRSLLGGIAPVAKRVVLPTELIVRASTARVALRKTTHRARAKNTAAPL